MQVPLKDLFVSIEEQLKVFARRVFGIVLGLFNFAQRRQYLYEYRRHVMKSTASESNVIDGRIEYVYKYIRKDEFDSLFGGYILSLDAGRDDVKYIGVWGNDKIRKFKQVMRERWASFSILSTSSSRRILKVLSRAYGDHSGTKVFLD